MEIQTFWFDLCSLCSASLHSGTAVLGKKGRRQVVLLIARVKGRALSAHETNFVKEGLMNNSPREEAIVRDGRRGEESEVRSDNDAAGV